MKCVSCEQLFSEVLRVGWTATVTTEWFRSIQRCKTKTTMQCFQISNHNLQRKSFWRKWEERKLCGQRGGTEGGYISWWALSWPGLASVWFNYVELIWRLHSVCQVSTAIIMQLWAFILSCPTVHPPNPLLQENASIRCFSFFPLFILPHYWCASCF